MIEEDCFKPYYEVYGFGYKTACKMASAIGLSNEDPRRLDAYIYELARQLSMATGNTYITFATIFQNVRGVNESLIQEVLIVWFHFNICMLKILESILLLYMKMRSRLPKS